MPFWGLQKQLGIDVDSFLLRQSMPQPHGQAAVCHAFEREWVECGHGLGQTRARRECQLEYEDFMECMQRTKLVGERGGHRGALGGHEESGGSDKGGQQVRAGGVEVLDQAGEGCRGSWQCSGGGLGAPAQGGSAAWSFPM